MKENVKAYLTILQAVAPHLKFQSPWGEENLTADLEKALGKEDERVLSGGRTGAEAEPRERSVKKTSTAFHLSKKLDRAIKNLFTNERVKQALLNGLIIETPYWFDQAGIDLIIGRSDLPLEGSGPNSLHSHLQNVVDDHGKHYRTVTVACAPDGRRFFVFCRPEREAIQRWSQMKKCLFKEVNKILDWGVKKVGPSQKRVRI